MLAIAMRGSLTLPLPALPGSHQANAALAVAMLRHQQVVAVARSDGAGILPPLARPAATAGRWPALPRWRHAVWLDSGHNPDAGLAIATSPCGPKIHLVTGMLANKDPSAIIAPLADRLLSLSIVPAPGHDAHRPEDFAPFTTLPAGSFANVAEALAALPPEGDVLIAGSLYLAGDVLRRNGKCRIRFRRVPALAPG
jgi:dihydrofolate synthase/folylpolyglutamate synthase